MIVGLGWFFVGFLGCFVAVVSVVLVGSGCGWVGVCWCWLVGGCCWVVVGVLCVLMLF